MSDFSQITSRLFTGAALDSEDDIKDLQKAGITHVIDCRKEFDDSALLGSNFAYCWNGTDDDGQEKPSEWFKRGAQFGLPALIVPKSKILAHCQAGVNRGPSLTYFLMRCLGFEPQDAIDIIHKNRPVTEGGIRYAKDADKAIDDLHYD